MQYPPSHPNGWQKKPQRQWSLSLKIVKEDFFLNEQRLRYSVEGFTSFKYLLTQWKKRLIGEVVFKSTVDEMMLREFIFTLISLEEGREENATLFTEQLVNRGISSIEVNPLEVVEGEEEGAVTFQKEDQKEVANKVFFPHRDGRWGTFQKKHCQNIGSL